MITTKDYIARLAAAQSCYSPPAGRDFTSFPKSEMEWTALNVPTLTDDEAIELERLCGCRVWRKDGKKHREDGPAIIGSDGFWAWYYEGQRHRLDGPAVRRTDGSLEWWVRGVQEKLL